MRALPSIEQLLRGLRFYLNKRVKVSPEYVEGFMRAEKTFLFQAVFDPLTRQAIPLHPFPKGAEPDSLAYAGRYYNAQTRRVCTSIRTLQ